MGFGGGGGGEDKGEANFFLRGRRSSAKTLKIHYLSTIKEEQFIMFPAK